MHKITSLLLIIIMTTRYETLNVSVSSERRPNRAKLNKTIDILQKDDQQSKTDNDQKANKFKELYYKNQKLRKELKVLNEKLNEKLEKLKLPSVKKKAMSVDLNHNPPSKALTRQLENAYKQVSMYKKQIQVLKSKEQTSQNYDKLRNMENMIGYMDYEISQVQQQLKSIKNVKKLQQKVISEDVDNVEIKQRVVEYQNQVKNFKQKLKDIDRKARKREQQFKKQQAYLIVLEKKIRKNQAEERQEEKPQIEKPKQMTEQQFDIVKDELSKAKIHYDQLIKRIEIMRKSIKTTKQQRILCEQKLKQKQSLQKQVTIQCQSFTRLLKDLQLKRYEQTGVRAPTRQKELTKILKLEQIEDDSLENKSASESQGDISKSSQMTPAVQKSANPKEWRGKIRKISMGYTVPTDQVHQQSGSIQGIKIYLDENRFITGIVAIMSVEGRRTESKLMGNFSNIELKWEKQADDEISHISGSFTQQGYLGEVILKTKNGLSARFGSQNKDKFSFKLEKLEHFSGIFVGLRKLGQDIRITQLGFWISNSLVNKSQVSK